MPLSLKLIQLVIGVEKAGFILISLLRVVLGKLGLVQFKPLLAKPQTKPLRISQTKLKLKPN
jgi:hypothetical protein